MPLTYHNTRTGRTVKVPTPEEAAAKSSAPKRARRRQEKLLTALSESNRWVAVDGSGQAQRPAAHATGPDAGAQHGPDVTVSGRLAETREPVRHERTPAEDSGAEHPSAPGDAPTDTGPSTEPETAPEPSIGDVRAWAKEQGIEVSARGRISEDVVEAYKAAHTSGGGE